MIAGSLRPSTPLAVSSASTHLQVRLRCASLRFERRCLGDTLTPFVRQTTSLIARSDTWRKVTYNGQASRVSNNVMKALVILTIAWVAYWAATGGLDQIAVPETVASST